jgi:hypothetical protein
MLKAVASVPVPNRPALAHGAKNCDKRSAVGRRVASFPGCERGKSLKQGAFACT